MTPAGELSSLITSFLVGGDFLRSLDMTGTPGFWISCFMALTGFWRLRIKELLPETLTCLYRGCSFSICSRRDVLLLRYCLVRPKFFVLLL